MKRSVLCFVFCAMLSGCSWLPSWSFWPFNGEENKVVENQQPENLGVNPYLWQATLAKLSFMPLMTADSRGGVVISDWTKMDDNSNESFKVTVNILTKDLRADGLDVKVFKKTGNSAERIDQRLAAEIEKSILAEARHILRRRVASREE